MKRSSLLTILALPIFVACNANNAENTEDSKYQNVKTTDYTNIKASEIHPAIDEGFVEVPYLQIGELKYEQEEDEKNYLYRLSCKDKTDSFSNHFFVNAEGEFCYVELSEKQNAFIDENFYILSNGDTTRGSSVEVNVDFTYECYSYREIFFSESEKMAKIVYYDHVIPGLEEDKVNSMVGVKTDKGPYVDTNKIRTSIDRAFEFTSGIEITYIDLSDTTYSLDK